MIHLSFSLLFTDVDDDEAECRVEAPRLRCTSHQYPRPQLSLRVPASWLIQPILTSHSRMTAIHPHTLKPLHLSPSCLGRAQEPILPWERRLQESCPTYGAPMDKPMPTEPEPAFLYHVVKPRLVGCALHAALPPDAPTMAIRVNGKPVTALLDSSSTVTLNHPTALGQLPEPTGYLLVSCIHRDIREVPATKVTVFALTNNWPLLVRLILELLVPLLLGRDWPGFPTQPTQRSHCR